MPQSMEMRNPSSCTYEANHFIQVTNESNLSSTQSSLGAKAPRRSVRCNPSETSSSHKTSDLPEPHLLKARALLRSSASELPSDRSCLERTLVASPPKSATNRLPVSAKGLLHRPRTELDYGSSPTFRLELDDKSSSNRLAKPFRSQALRVRFGRVSPPHTTRFR